MSLHLIPVPPYICIRIPLANTYFTFMHKPAVTGKRTYKFSCTCAVSTLIAPWDPVLMFETCTSSKVRAHLLLSLSFLLTLVAWLTVAMAIS